MVGITSKQWAYVILRWALAVNMFIHGATRIFGNWSGFVRGVQDAFAATVLPELLVTGFAWFIAPFELLVGLLLMVGFRTRTALVTGGLFMSVLIFGMGLLQEWDTLGTQMVYVLVFSLLLYGQEHNALCLDQV